MQPPVLVRAVHRAGRERVGPRQGVKSLIRKKHSLRSGYTRDYKPYEIEIKEKLKLLL